MAHWQQPGPPSRGLRLLVFGAVVLVIAVIAVSIVALLYAFPLSTPSPHLARVDVGLWLGATVVPLTGIDGGARWRRRDGGVPGRLRLSDGTCLR